MPPRLLDRMFLAYEIAGRVRALVARGVAKKPQEDPQRAAGRLLSCLPMMMLPESILGTEAMLLEQPLRGRSSQAPAQARGVSVRVVLRMPLPRRSWMMMLMRPGMPVLMPGMPVLIREMPGLMPEASATTRL